MFLNSWSLALTLCSLIVLALGCGASRTAIRVLRFWDPASDSNLQIRLENETWLASTLIEYALGFQIITLILFILAADHFCQMIVGAMCATGALLANNWGVPALLVKLAAVFLYGFWIVLHQLDVSSEEYPLVRIKYCYLLLLVPVLFADSTLQTLYIAKLTPDIITSCCAVVFRAAAAGESNNLIAGLDRNLLLALFYSTAACLAVIGLLLFRRRPSRFLLPTYSLLWLFFFVLALVAITSVFSSYIYAMPFHKCPFCILKPEYHYIGFALYGSLITAAFFGIAAAAVQPLGRKPDITRTVARFQKYSLQISLLLLTIFTLLCSYPFLHYIVTGGE